MLALCAEQRLLVPGSGIGYRDGLVGSALGTAGKLVHVVRHGHDRNMNLEYQQSETPHVSASYTSIAARFTLLRTQAICVGRNLLEAGVRQGRDLKNGIATDMVH